MKILLLCLLAPTGCSSLCPDSLSLGSSYYKGLGTGADVSFTWELKHDNRKAAL